MTYKKRSLNPEAQWVANKSMMFGSDSPFDAAVTLGDKRLLLIVGENASGKSLFFRVMCSRYHLKDITPITISIRERSASGTFEMAAMRRMFMFGDETDQSTGATSVKVVETAFKSNLGNKEGGCILGLDEPEIGLSDGYASAFGEFIGAQTLEIPSACSGVMVVTHSRSLVRGLLKGFGKAPTFVAVGGGPRIVEEWLEAPETHTIEELLNLPTVGLDRWRTVEKMLKEK